MKYTPKRFECLLAALNGEKFQGSNGIRKLLEKDGLLKFLAPNPNYYYSKNIPEECNYPRWRITDKGKRQLTAWISLKK